MTIIRTIEKEILDECKEDLVYFSSVISWVMQDFKTELTPRVRRIALDLIYRNLIDENFVACQFNQKSEIVIWDLSPEQILTRIEREWDELGRTPTINDICFFRTLPFDRFIHVPDEERKKMGLD